jgi:hypothetical protein
MRKPIAASKNLSPANARADFALGPRVRDASSFACHPEAGGARRGTSHAFNRFREVQEVYVRAAVLIACVMQVATGRSLAVCAARDDIADNRELTRLFCSRRPVGDVSVDHGASQRDAATGSWSGVEARKRSHSASSSSVPYPQYLPVAVANIPASTSSPVISRSAFQ